MHHPTTAHGESDVLVVGAGPTGLTLAAQLHALRADVDPDVVARSHCRERVIELRGADQVARGALRFRRFALFVRPALINGAAVS
jgi:2-polyprenyl-6-methoxyphenol hydroxylase-like FAD-dependent oxidoreductase